MAIPGKHLTKEEKQFIIDNYPRMKNKDLGALMNRRADSIFEAARRLGLKKCPEFMDEMRRESGFKIGTRANNTTLFKKGSKPHNTRPDGDIRETKVGGVRYKQIKVDGKWMNLHRYVWIQKYGSIPDNHYVIFNDKDTFNCNIENLSIISKQENVARNRIHHYPEELKQVIKLTNKLTKKIIKHEKHNPGSKGSPNGSH